MENDQNPRFLDGYRSVLRFDLERGENAQALAEYFLRDWLALRARGKDDSALDAWDGNEEVTLPSGTLVETTRFEDGRSGQSAVRYRVTDHKPDGRYQVRVSATTNPQQNTKQSSRAAFLVEAGRDFGSREEAMNSIHPPSIVANILESRRVIDGVTRLQAQPRIISRDNAGELLTAVADSARSVPLLVAASLSMRADEQWRSVMRRLTRTAIGTAAVFVVDSDAVEDVNNALPEVLRTPPGHLRAVAPRVDMENPDMRRHPLWTPDDLTAWLGPGGKPSDEAVAALAKEPRGQLLEAALPSDLRRIVQLLDQQERKKQLAKEVEERVADVSQIDEAASDEAVGEAVEVTIGFPRRSEIHGQRRGAEDFWPGFRAMLAQWLGKPASEVGEDSVEENLYELDQKMVRDREALRVNEQFLESVEEQRDDLHVVVSGLKEQNDSLAVQLETAQNKLDEAEDLIEKLRAQLEELSVAPAELTARVAPVGGLEDKLQQVTVTAVDPHVEVGDALRFMSERLDPIIQAKLAPYLDGRPWTWVLEQLDVQKGRSPGTHRRTDPAAQLRMLTEKLGNAGFPFEVDSNRTVSTPAQQLRGLRNRWSHNEDLEPLDVWRAYDAVFTLLRALGDDEGARTAEERRGEFGTVAALPLAGQPTVGAPEPQPGPAEDTGEDTAEDTVQDTVEDTVQDTVEDTVQDTVQDTGETSTVVDNGRTGPLNNLEGHPNVIDVFLSEIDDAERSEPVQTSNAEEGTEEAFDVDTYQPWKTVDALPTEHLDWISMPSNRRLVRATIEEIVRFEGPVKRSQLTKLVAAQFGVSRVYPRRRRIIELEIGRSAVTIDDDGFVWPGDTDPEQWDGFRTTLPGTEREFLDISPVEIRNAARYIAEQQPYLNREQLEDEVLRVFDRQRKTQQVAGYLRQSLEPLE